MFLRRKALTTSNLRFTSLIVVRFVFMRRKALRLYNPDRDYNTGEWYNDHICRIIYMKEDEK